MSSSLLPSLSVLLVLGLLPLAACSGPGGAPVEGPAESAPEGADVHSYARPEEVAVEHLVLDLDVDFGEHRLRGWAGLRLAPRDRGSEPAARLHLDTRDLEIHRVLLDRRDGEEAPFTLGEERTHLGRPLVVDIAPNTEMVWIEYATLPAAAALQWLAPEQTAGGEHPFLFTQSQAILARTWIPCQDTPAVRMTYEATVRVPPPLLALMSAENPTEVDPEGVYHFHMPQAIPSYLMALAVGDLEFRPLGPQSGVYAEPPVIERAVDEFAETPAMIAAAEELYGPYRWGRYDLLVLPPSFPFGGMENPRLTFVTPTILAGDRSLVTLVAHELAHSWSGNLVTNATWNDFWLNEGFTVYFERRVMEEIYGRDYAEMLTLLGRQDLERTIQRMRREGRLADAHLRLALGPERDPDEGMSDVAYEKGYFFLRAVEEAVGRERFDAFLRQYFDRFAFRSMDTDAFVAYLKENLLRGDGERARELHIDDWVYGPGLPENMPEVSSPAFARVEAEIEAWRGGKAAAELDTAGWSTHQWLHFIRHLPEDLTPERMAELDAAFAFTGSGNAEILSAWLLRAVQHRYEAAYPALEQFLTTVGRRKFLEPLYRRLAATPEGLEMARDIYARARPTYHPLTRATVDQILNSPPDAAAHG